jgi:hypothetical protein
MPQSGELQANSPAGWAHKVVGKLSSMENGLVLRGSGSNNDDRFLTGEREVATPLFSLSLPFPPTSSYSRCREENRIPEK